jgi:hypothetical protein
MLQEQYENSFSALYSCSCYFLASAQFGAFDDVSGEATAMLHCDAGSILKSGGSAFAGFRIDQFTFGAQCHRGRRSVLFDVSARSLGEDEAGAEDEVLAAIAAAEAASSSSAAGASELCSFMTTGPNFKVVKYFYCDTCPMNDSNGEGVCVACAAVCHKGHALREQPIGMGFYCDCALNKASHGGEACALREAPPRPAAAAAAAADGNGDEVADGPAAVAIVGPVAPPPPPSRRRSPANANGADANADGYRFYLLKITAARRGEGGTTVYLRAPRFMVHKHQARWLDGAQS